MNGLFVPTVLPIYGHLFLWIGTGLAVLLFLPELRRWAKANPRETRIVLGVVLAILLYAASARAADVPLVGCDDPNISWWEYWFRGCALRP